MVCIVVIGRLYGLVVYDEQASPTPSEIRVTFDYRKTYIIIGIFIYPKIV
jgi:hypothetical protein